MLKWFLENWWWVILTVILVLFFFLPVILVVLGARDVAKEKEEAEAKDGLL
jgi:ABC-type transport system involved in multi-copper enzyme maturation permease subunit